jgi:hypothetical protein
MEVGGQLHAPVALTRGKQPSVLSGQEDGWTPEKAVRAPYKSNMNDKMYDL